MGTSHSRTLNRVAFIVLFLILNGGVFLWTRRGSNLNNPAPRGGDNGSQLLTVDEAAVNLGDRWEGSRVSHSMTFRNMLDESLIVEEFRTSCDCTSTRKGPISVGAHSEVSAVFEIDFSRSSTSNDVYPHLFSVQIQPIIRGHMPQKPWTLSASVEKAIVPSAQSIDFGEIAFDQLPELQTLTATLPPGFDLAGNCLHKGDSVSIARRVDQKHVFDVFFRSRALTSPGLHSSAFDLIARDSRSGDTASCRIPVTARVYGPFRVTPMALHLGLVYLSEDRQVNVQVEPRSGIAASISGVRSSDDSRFAATLFGSRDCPRPANGLVCDMIIVGKSIGLVTGTITIDLDTGGGRVESCELPVSFMCTMR